jgi:protein TonB
VALAALLALAIATLRYAPFRDAAAPPSVAVLGEIEPPAPAPAPQHERPQERPPPTNSAENQAPPPETAPLAATLSDPVVITEPVWVERPRNLARFYPREAFMRGLDGQVVLDCIVEATGRLECTIASETPEDLGFGAAALAIAGQHVMQPARQNGAPVRGRYRMTVPFTAG